MGQHMMSQQMQQQQQQHMHQQVSGPPQGQMGPPGVSQQGGPPGQHPQGGPPGQQPQPQHIYQQQPPSHQPPRPQVSSMNTSMNTSMTSLPTGAPPPAATTPPTMSSGPPSLPPQNIPSQPPSAQNTLNRTRKRIAIIDPNTRQEVSVDGTSKTPAQVPPPASTPEQSSTSSTPAPESAEKPSRSSSGVAAEFAAKVAAVAEGSAKKEDSPAPMKDPTSLEESKESAEEATQESKEAEEAPKEDVESEPVAMPGTPPPVYNPDTSSTLSVTTDLKREEPLYEPVSPTPLPDSPMDENKVAEVTKPSPFEEVINKKAGVTGIEKRDQSADEALVEAKRGKKKQSQASKRAALNSKDDD